MGKLLEHDAEIRGSVLDIYDSVVSMFEMKNFEKNLRKELATEYGEYNKLVESNMNHLRRKHCPIVVAGRRLIDYFYVWSFDFLFFIAWFSIIVLFVLFIIYLMSFVWVISTSFVTYILIIFKRRDKFRKVIFAKPFHWRKGATWTFAEFHSLYLPNI